MLAWLNQHEYMMMLAILAVSIGVTLVIVGNLFAMAYAFGQNIWWGVAVMLIPLLSVIYCARNWDKAAYPGKMIYSGFAILGCSYLLFMFLAMFDSA